MKKSKNNKNNLSELNESSKIQLKEKQAFDYIYKGELKKAEEIYKSLIREGFANYSTYINLSVICGRQNNQKERIILLQKALELNPFSSTALNNLGNALRSTGSLESAVSYYRKALDIRPNYPEAECNLGIALQEKGDNQSAIISFKKALKLKKNYPEAYSNLGIALFDLGELDEAIKSYQIAIKLKPNYHQTYLNLGNAYQAQGYHLESINCYKKAIKIKPDYASANWNLSLSYLLYGNYESGWEYYHWRWKIRGAKKPHAEPLINELKGNILVREENLLVVSEQGLGDTIQYMRYIPYLRSLGVKVSFCAQLKLHNLIKASKIDINPLTSEEANLVSNGKWISLLNIPKILKVKPCNPIITKPYIQVTEEYKVKWKNLLDFKERPLIGLNWQGNPKLEKSNYKGRSIPLEKFSKIIKGNDLTLISLQKGFGSDQLNTCSFKEKFIKSQEVINSSWDFHDNAAIIHHCDLIITCDTVVAHLAGGMGKRVWLLLRDLPFWTWGLEDDHTFWYPSMKLFRQNTRDNWDEVIERVSLELKKSINTLML